MERDEGSREIVLSNIAELQALQGRHDMPAADVLRGEPRASLAREDEVQRIGERVLGHEVGGHERHRGSRSLHHAGARLGLWRHERPVRLAWRTVLLPPPDGLPLNDDESAGEVEVRPLQPNDLAIPQAAERHDEKEHPVEPPDQFAGSLYLVRLQERQFVLGDVEAPDLLHRVDKGYPLVRVSSRMLMKLLARRGRPLRCVRVPGDMTL